MFIGLSLTDANRHDNNGPGTIYVLETFVQVINISAVTEPILTKGFGPNFFGAIIFLGQNFFLDQTSFDPNTS